MITSNDGWNGWPGGNCPVKEDVIVDIKLTNGKIIKETPAGRWLWQRPMNEPENKPNKIKNGGVIAAYRRSKVLESANDNF